MYEVACPTCADSKPLTCCGCGRALPASTVEDLAPDPFANEVNDCTDLHLQCDLCLQQSALDI